MTIRTRCLASISLAALAFVLLVAPAAHAKSKRACKGIKNGVPTKNCVTWNDMANDSVGGRHVVDGSLTGADVQDGSLNSLDLSDAAGVSESFGATDYVEIQNPTTVRSVSITAPAAGLHVISVDGSYEQQQTPAEFECALEDGAGALLKLVRGGIGGADVGRHNGSLYMQRVIAAPAGTATYQLKCSRLTGNTTYLYNPSIQVLYVPERY